MAETPKPIKLRDINEYINALITSERMGDSVVYHRLINGRTADYAELDKPWPEEILAILEKQGITRLYHHQVEAINHIRSGRHLAAATPTASGKTLIYNLPVLENIITRPTSKALYIFPLKALAQDQLRAFQKLSEGAADFNFKAQIYDGDTDYEERRKIRENPPHVLLTNPEMIHLSLLPYHYIWSDFWRGLEVVVVDEVHTYRGVMGSHISQVLRRLRRICGIYGTSPTFIFCSATVANPSQLVEQLTGLQPETVIQSGAPKGRQHLVFINSNENIVSSTLMLLKAAIYRKLRTIVYTQSRKLAELIALRCKQSLGKKAECVSAYRAGFLPDERRDIEAGLADGRLLAVISTSALELGIDVGDLDLCLLVGYPGSIVATWQRVGRVGRGGQDSAFILIAGENALDQYFVRNPDALLNRQPESATANPFNPVVLQKHLLCAAAEKKLLLGEPLLSNPVVNHIVRLMLDRGELIRLTNNRLRSWCKYPHRTVDLRGTGNRYQITDSVTRKIIGEIEGFRAYEETHPGAVYIHKGNTYIIDHLDSTAKIVIARSERTEYYTRIRTVEQTDILDVMQEKTVDNTRICFGRLKITRQVLGYEKCGLYGKHTVMFVPLELPPVVFETEGLWWVIPPEIENRISASLLDFSGGIHAIEHAAIGVFPLLVMADPNDLGGLSTPYHHQTQLSSIFIYDGVPGGAGLTQAAFHQIKNLFDDTLTMMNTCLCEAGCPSCVHSPKCGSGNRPLDKAAAIEIMKLIQSSAIKPLTTPKKISEPEINYPNTKPVTTPKEISEPEINYPNIKLVTKPTETSEPEINPAPQPQTIHYGVFDLETQLSADDVGGWNHADRMLISCAVLYDSAVNDYLVFLEDNVTELVELMQTMDLIIGFNTIKFDFKVLKAYSDFPFQHLPNLDILQEIKSVLGYRCSLDHIARNTLGTPKSANGIQAIEWWKQGRLQDIIDYCRKDVEITRDLYLFGKKHGYLLIKNKKGRLLRVAATWAD